MALTVGYVSGIIALLVFVVRVFIPHATALIVVGVVRSTSPLTTWTVVSRELFASKWPTLLRTDSETRVGVSRGVRYGAWSRRIASYLVAIASIVTPMGLYDTIRPTVWHVERPFGYSPDTSAIGFGTPARSNLGFTRMCGAYNLVACPGQDLVIRNDSGRVSYPNGYNMSIPRNITEAFESGLASMSPTVSSIWDIEWRTYNIVHDEDGEIQNGEDYLVGRYRQLQILALNDAIEPVEGLIVDTKNAGVGFRNHTTPSPNDYGSVWTEDLLFIEPHTTCVDTNLTLDFELNNSASSGQVSNLVLTDRGGFANLIREYPTYDRYNSQSDVQLWDRAYKAAWLSNVLTMVYLNVTNPRDEDHERPFMYLDSHVGKTFPLDLRFLNTISYDSFLTSTAWGKYLDLESSLSKNLSSNSTSSKESRYPNPFDITSDNFTDVSTLCKGAGGLDIANITNVGVVCGQVYGAARRVDGGPSLVFQPGSRWSIPLYSCASAAQAVIKTVEFTYNGTDGLRSLEVKKIEDKKYDRDEDKPLWGVENTQMELQHGQPIWGLVSEEYKDRSDISVIQKESLWLPGYYNGIRSTLNSPYNLPGATFHTLVLGVVYSLDELDPQVQGTADYTAASNLGMYAKWQELSKSPNTTSKIIDLVWTDLAANGVVGTRGWLSEPVSKSNSRNSVEKRATTPTAGETREVSVTDYNKVIRYQWAFGVPAFLSCLVVGLIAAQMLFLMCVGRSNFGRLRLFLNQTSVGRLMGTFLYPGLVDPTANTRNWAPLAASKKVDVTGPVPRAADPVMTVNRDKVTAAEDPLLYEQQQHMVR